MNSFSLDNISPEQVNQLELLAAKQKISIQVPFGSPERTELQAEALNLGKRFEVRCKPNVPFDQLHPLDQEEGPREVYECENATTEDEALDDFHNRNPIKVLDHYDIEAVCIYRLPE